jgi:hypothetical protein
MRRAELSVRLVSFARGMRSHIRREDELMYSSAPKLLTAADWRGLAKSATAPLDPLAAPAGTSGPYPALARYVRDGEAEARVGTLPSRPLERALSAGTQFADLSISCLRLLLSQASESSRTAFSVYAAAVRPAMPRKWRAGVAAALNDGRAARARWVEQWRELLGLVPEEA